MSSKGPVQRTFKHDFRAFLAWPLVCNVRNVYTSRLRLCATTPNNVGSCCVRVGSGVNGLNNSQQCWDLQCIVGRIQPISLCKPRVMSVPGPNNVVGAVQTDPTLLHYASAITEQKICWELLTEKFDRFQTLRNNTQQHPTTCNRCANGRNM